MKKKLKNSSAPQSQEEVVEHVKARLQEEGREARNLVAYSLPLEGFASSSSSSSSVDQILAAGSRNEEEEPHQSNKLDVETNVFLKADFMNPESEVICNFTSETASSSCRVLPHSIPECPSEDPSDSVHNPDLTLDCSGMNITAHPSPSPSSQASRTPLLSPTPSIISSESLPRNLRLKVHDNNAREASLSRRGSVKQEKRSRSVSAGRNPHQCLRARHWGFLFRNLQQAVDQIYQTCETDESVIECREAILMLERYTKDFRKLIEWLQIKWEYENTPAPQRPTSLAWEVRTRSQTKEPRPLTIKDVRRALNFDFVKQSPGTGESESTSNRSSSASIADMAKVHQLAAEIAADLTLSSRLNFAAKVDKVLSDRGSMDNSPGGRLESALSDLVLEETETSDEGSGLRPTVSSDNYGSDRREKDRADNREGKGKAPNSQKLKSPKCSPSSKSSETKGKVKSDETFKIPPVPKQSKKLKSKTGGSKTSPEIDSVSSLTKETLNLDRQKLCGKEVTSDEKLICGEVNRSDCPDLRCIKKCALPRATDGGCVEGTSSGGNNAALQSSNSGSTDISVADSSRIADSCLSQGRENTNSVESDFEVTAAADPGVSKSIDNDTISIVKELQSNKFKNSESREDCSKASLSKSTSELRPEKKLKSVSKPLCSDTKSKSKSLNSSLHKVDATTQLHSSHKTTAKIEPMKEDTDADLKKFNSTGSEPKNLPLKSDQKSNVVRENDAKSLGPLKTETKPNNQNCKSDTKAASSISKSEPKNILKAENKASNAAKQDSKSASHSKSESRNISRPDSRNNTAIKADVKKETGVEAKKLGAEAPSCATTPASKASGAKTPVVTMNKAWQVRQAFNQSRAPLRQHPQPPGISSLGDAAPQCCPVPLHPQPWLSGSAPSYSAHIRLRGALQQAGGRGGVSRRCVSSAPSSSGLPTSDVHGALTSGRPDLNPPRCLARSHTTLAASTCGRLHEGRQPSHRRSLGDTPSSSASSQPQSWADKVKGSSVSSPSSIAPTTPSSSASTASLLSSQAEESGYPVDGADDGWEVVRRGRRSYGGSTASLNQHQHNTAAAVPSAVVVSSLEAANKLLDATSTSWYRKRYHTPSSATSLPSLSSLNDAGKTTESPGEARGSDEAPVAAGKRLSFGGETGKTIRSEAKSGNRQVKGSVDSSRVQNDKRKLTLKESDQRTRGDPEKPQGARDRISAPRSTGVDKNSGSNTSGKRMSRKEANPKNTFINRHKVLDGKENTSSLSNVSVSLPSLPVDEDCSKSTAGVSKCIKSGVKGDSACFPSTLRKSKSFVHSDSESVKPRERELRKEIHSGAIASPARDAKLHKKRAKRVSVPNTGHQRKVGSESKSEENLNSPRMIITGDNNGTASIGADKKGAARDPKNFFKRGKASSDACLELRGRLKVGETDIDSATGRRKLESRDKFKRKSSNLPPNSRDDKSGTVLQSSRNNTPQDGTAGVPYRYGEVMAELHEEADEAASADGSDANTGKAGTGRADAGRADAGRADAGKADAGKADAGKADAGKADAGKADAGKADAGKADAGKADAGKADAGKADAGKADAGKADAGKADAGKADAGKADAGKADAGKADAGKADAGKADAGKADAGKADAGKADDGEIADVAEAVAPQVPEIWNSCKEELSSMDGRNHSTDNNNINTKSKVSSKSNNADNTNSNNGGTCEEEDPEDAADEANLRHNAAAIESAVAEEERLKQQIHDTENTDCASAVSGDNSSESGSETSSLITNCDLGSMSPQTERSEPDESRAHKDSSGAGGGRRQLNTPVAHDDDDDDGDELEMDSRAILEMFASLDWSEESLESASYRGVLESSGVREPGRVLQIHEKLSSPSRKLPLHEKLRRHNEKLAKAEMLRQNFITTKTEKLKELFKRIEEVSMDKERLLEEKRHLLERKMDRAEEKRRRHLQDIVAKAHDEDNKGREIAFINGLEAQNKLHDLIQQHQSHSSRLADMAEERSRRQEEKAAKEAAAQERRKALEAERQARLLELCEKRRERCERIDRQQAERREELLEQAREKARDRQERLTALLQAQQAKEDELVRRIQQKQQESARRHEENIEQIKRRALESTILRCSTGCDDAPKICRYERQKLCTLCQCLLSSEVYLLSHLRGARHQEALRELYDGKSVSSEDTASCNLKHIVDAPDNMEDPQVTRDKERQKTLKKRCRKIRLRMASRGSEYANSYKRSSAPASASSKRINKALFVINKLKSNQGSGPWGAAEVAALDKALLELLRILDKKTPGDQEAFCAHGGFEKITEFLGTLFSDDDKSISGSSDDINLAAAKENNKENRLEKPTKGSSSSNSKRKKKNNSGSASQQRITSSVNISKTENCGTSINKNKQRSSQNLVEDNDDDDLGSLLSLNMSSSDTLTVPSCVVPEKSVGLCSRVLLQAVAGHPGNSRHLLYSNLVVVLLDWLMQRLQRLQRITADCGGATAGSVGGPAVLTLPSDPAVTHTLEVLAEVLSVVSEADLNNNTSNCKDDSISQGAHSGALADVAARSSSCGGASDALSDMAWLRLQDLVSYCVCGGVADRLSWYLSHVQGPAPLEADPAVAHLILAAMALLSALVNTLLRGLGSNYKGDPTQLLNTLQVTDACGVVSLLYGLLLHDGGRSAYLSTSATTTETVTPCTAPSSLTTSTSSSLLLTPVTTPSPVHQSKPGSSSKANWSGDVPPSGSYVDSLCSSSGPFQPAKLQPDIEKITVAATTLLRNLAVLDLGVFQGVLGSEGISLELRHVASHLLWHSSYWPAEDVLNNVIALVGFLTVNNPDNQCVVQSGETPTVLQQLCGLPWQYFSEPRLTAVLFPTLLACCVGNPHNTSILNSEMSAQVLEDYVRDEGESCTNPLMNLLLQSKVGLQLTACPSTAS